MSNKEDMLENQDIIDEDAFGQLIELDEDDDTGFLDSVVHDWFTQAKKTFADMDKALKDKDLLEFSKRAHFLKGSSGQIGIIKVRDSCSTLQHYGELWDESKTPEKTQNLSEEEANRKIPPVLKQAKADYKEAKKWLKDYLDDDSEEEEEEEEPEAEAEAEDLETPKAEERKSLDVKVGKKKP